jgi:hypothetical protein
LTTTIIGYASPSTLPISLLEGQTCPPSDPDDPGVAAGGPGVDQPFYALDLPLPLTCSDGVTYLGRASVQASTIYFCTECQGRTEEGEAFFQVTGGFDVTVAASFGSTCSVRGGFSLGGCGGGSCAPP